MVLFPGKNNLNINGVSIYLPRGYGCIWVLLCNLLNACVCTALANFKKLKWNIGSRGYI